MRPNRSIEASINKTTNRLRLILGDQLNQQHSWFSETDPQVVYLIAELPQETNYTRHHVQKICAFFAAMEQFAYRLADKDHQVIYLTLEETHGFSNLDELLQAVIDQHSLNYFDYQRPDEYRLANQLADFNPEGVSKEQVETEHFLLPFEDLSKEFKADKPSKMEFFYRRMRKRFGFLMDSGQPEGGKWNYDGENRSALKAKDLPQIPEPKLFKNDVTSILERLHQHDISTIGEPQEQLIWPIDRHQSLQLLDYFCEHLLPRFGQFQDAMTDQSDFKWSLYHSRLSFAINTKLLSPREVVEAAIEQWCDNKVNISLAQIEGFVRQIIGWREYIRGIYWVNMPGYGHKNFLNAKRSLPEYFWSADTKMNCLKQAIGQSLEYAYAHHIQRLMITGNFCLLTEIDPHQVDEWYLGIYIDAIEWVEMPNTRGMSQFADGGLIATKPYAASGSYVNKMSDYCKSCHYNVKNKTESDACPLNSLYWRFVYQNTERFKDNQRMGMVYNSWNKMGKDKQQALLNKAKAVLQNIETL